MKPLANRTVLVTRARSNAGRLSYELRALGAEVLEIPAIAIVPPESYEALDAALRELHAYDWLLLTSANAVHAMQQRMREGSVPLALPLGVLVAAVGPATARAADEAGWRVAVMPEEAVAESLLETLGDRVARRRVLYARSALARDVLPEMLRARGARVDVADAYGTEIPAGSVEKMRSIFGSGGRRPDAVMFASSSSVNNFLALMAAAGVERGDLRAISIGPVTTATLLHHRWKPVAEAAPHDVPGLVQAVVGVLSS